LGPTSYDVVVIGSGFGSLFFMEGFMKKRPKARFSSVVRVMIMHGS
jgi:NADH dehydrogenase FAD-containing subunit